MAGCSTGEEVYSLAILLIEYLGEKASHIPIQIFASDISEQAIQKARMGEYPETIEKDVSTERLSRFFTKLDGGGYKIAKSVRDVCLFSRHDLTADPPYAKIDLISCRNVLIYFAPSLQKYVLPIFHYALTSDGSLWLGKSETIGGFSDLFMLVDKINKIYVRKNATVSLSLRFPPNAYTRGMKPVIRTRTAYTKVARNVKDLAEQATQLEYPGVLINQDMEILHLRGRTAPFIEPSAGQPSYNLLKMAHPDLVRDLRMSLQAATKSHLPFRKEGLSLKVGRTRTTFNLNVIPLPKSDNSKERLYLIVFERYGGIKMAGKVPAGKKSAVKKDPYIYELQNELIESQNYQNTLIEKFEAAQ